MPRDNEFFDDVAIFLAQTWNPTPVPGDSNYNAYHARLLKLLGSTELYAPLSSPVTLDNTGTSGIINTSSDVARYTFSLDIPPGVWGSVIWFVSWSNDRNGEVNGGIGSVERGYYLDVIRSGQTDADGVHFRTNITTPYTYYPDYDNLSYKKAGGGSDPVGFWNTTTGFTQDFQIFYECGQNFFSTTEQQHKITFSRIALLLIPPDPVLATGEFAAGSYAYNARQIVEARGSGLSYDVSDSGRHYHAYAQAGTIRVGAATNVLATSWQDIDTGIEGSFPWIRVQKQHRNQLLWLFYIASDGSLQTCSSTDEGRTWGAAEEIAASGGYPSLDITRDGRHYFYWRGSDGSIQGKAKDNAGKTMLDTFTALPAGTADDAGIACREFTTGGGVWRIKLTYFSGGDIVDVSSRDGVNFT